MVSKWKKMKLALSLNLCNYLPRTLEEEPPSLALNSAETLSDAALLSPLNWPMTPTPSSYRRRLSRSSSKSSKQTCSICLNKMKEGCGHAIFTAECSHMFHFHCIASNVKHGNQVCPVCRAKWKEIPIQKPSLDLPYYPFDRCNNDAAISLFRCLPPSQRAITQGHPEPATFDDDERLEEQIVFDGETEVLKKENRDYVRMMDMKVYPEVSAVPQSKSCENFDVLVHLKAVTGDQISQYRRAPIDLVTVLDISGSMGGTKLALLKRAMGFVIQNLGSSDRLSVIAFSSTARRLFPLTRMSDAGRQLALQAVNSLVANGGTNIVDGLRKGAKVMEDRLERNSVASIILLSDGRDTYTTNHPDPSYKDALAQCIGGLLSVAVQELRVEIEGVSPNVRLSSIKAGSYSSLVTGDGHSGLVDLGDLYADEERDFLVSINIPVEEDGHTPLLKLRCLYINPLTKEITTLESHVLQIRRPEYVAEEKVVPIEVVRQRNRFLAAEAMAQARTLAEHGDLEAAVKAIENFRLVLAETVAAKSCDRFCVALDSELKEMQGRMRSSHMYEASGRAYILSGLSSHSWQRATARGNSRDSSSFVQAYQTPSMAEMLRRSQAMFLVSPSHHRLIQPLLSFASQPKPR
ncbi:Zinc finger (C3HC4-type RING finger) family protein [Arabidopsis thaliana]|nr:Zinc finger (C3HC4-type RING finger) family protein [Arabidopsis thaliana]AEE79286.1 Zinc finger (C3HC4-type RING finger) family protein [Arabidopsis thaliana]|eukprot:NP_001030861.1 Zinc finger (C3HC4-type RING finger) family protein [Arabidopsis thaliana]